MQVPCGIQYCGPWFFFFTYRCLLHPIQSSSKNRFCMSPSLHCFLSDTLAWYIPTTLLAGITSTKQHHNRRCHSCNLGAQMRRRHGSGKLMVTGCGGRMFRAWCKCHVVHRPWKKRHNLSKQKKKIKQPFCPLDFVEGICLVCSIIYFQTFASCESLTQRSCMLFQ